jgi:hypothetical protein
MSSNSINSINSVNSINSINSINSVNSINSINSINSVNETDTITKHHTNFDKISGIINVVDIMIFQSKNQKNPTNKIIFKIDPTKSDKKILDDIDTREKSMIFNVGDKIMCEYNINKIHINLTSYANIKRDIILDKIENDKYNITEEDESYKNSKCISMIYYSDIDKQNIEVEMDNTNKKISLLEIQNLVKLTSVNINIKLYSKYYALFKKDENKIILYNTYCISKIKIQNNEILDALILKRETKQKNETKIKNYKTKYYSKKSIIVNNIISILEKKIN